MEGANFRKEFRERTLGYIVGAFGLVAGLAWNDAITGLIEALAPVERDTVIVRFGYAILMTVLLVVITIYLIRLFKKA
ncbi:MAG: DUF5654 family protein [Patescibacteria group bacterium]